MRAAAKVAAALGAEAVAVDLDVDLGRLRRAREVAVDLEAVEIADDEHGGFSRSSR